MHKSGLLSFSGKFKSQDCSAHVPPAWRQSISTQERPLSLEMLSTLPISITPSPLTMERLPLYSRIAPAGALQAAESAAPAGDLGSNRSEVLHQPHQREFQHTLV